MPHINVKVHLQVGTPDLEPGDLVLHHGMQIRIGEQQVVNHHVDGVCRFTGVVENADVLCNREHPNYDRFIASFLRGGNAYDGERDRWDIQGNRLAIWWVTERRLSLDLEPAQ